MFAVQGERGVEDAVEHGLVGDWAKGFPIITRNDPSLIDDLVVAAA